MFFFINQVFFRAAFVCIAFSLAGASDEDDYSRFSYDQQMLDKIVKVEQKVEQMDKTLEDSMESFLAILQYRKEEMQTQGDSLTGNLTDFKKDIQAILQYRKEEMQTLGESLTGNLTEFRKEMQAILQYRKEEMQTLGKRMSDNFTEFRKEMQEMYEVPKIAFSARNPSSSTYRANQVLIMRETSLNEGSGYNGATGEFTAPLAGLYLFNAHFCFPSQSAAYIAIVVGSKGVAHSVHYDQNGTVCSSVNAVTRVEKGEKVFLQATHTTQLYTSTYWQSSFTGVRLSN